MPNGGATFMHWSREVWIVNHQLAHVWRVTPITSATSVRPTRSGVASINLASGTARRTSASALSTASLAVANSLQIRDRGVQAGLRPQSSSQPSSANFSISASVSVSLVGNWYLRVKVNSISIAPSLAGNPRLNVAREPAGLTELSGLTWWGLLGLTLCWGGGPETRACFRASSNFFLRVLRTPHQLISSM